MRNRLFLKICRRQQGNNRRTKKRGFIKTFFCKRHFCKFKRVICRTVPCLQGFCNLRSTRKHLSCRKQNTRGIFRDSYSRICLFASRHYNCARAIDRCKNKWRKTCKRRFNGVCRRWCNGYLWRKFAPKWRYKRRIFGRHPD